MNAEKDLKTCAACFEDERRSFQPKDGGREVESLKAKGREA
jgi:hypothetical protein